MLSLSIVFEILGVGRQEKTATAKMLFPELYDAWLKLSEESDATELQPALFYRIIQATAAKKYYQEALKYFGMAGAQEDPAALFGQRYNKLLSDFSSSDQIQTSSEIIKSLQEHLRQSVIALPQDKRAPLAEAYELLSVGQDEFSERTQEELRQRAVYYLILSLTAIPKNGSAADALSAIRQHCESTGFTQKPLIRMAREHSAQGDAEAAELLLEQAANLEHYAGKAEYEIARLKKADLERARSEAKRNAALEEYRQALNDACDQKYPIALIERARALYEGGLLERDPDGCAADCRLILQNPGRIIQRVLGEAYWLLYRLMEDKHDGARKCAEELCLGTAKQVLDRACEQNWRAAIELRSREEARRSVSLIHVLRRERSLESGVVFYGEDPDPKAFEVIESTRPKGWEARQLQRETLAASLRTVSDLPLMFLLLNREQERNLKDALAVLETIRNLPEIEPERVSIYLTGDEEQLAPLLDTAQEHMDGRIVPVTILDPEKNAAQQLLSRHPLFFALRDAKRIRAYCRTSTYGGMSERSYTLHFVIIGSSRCCEWLLREAFWMTTFRDLDLVAIRAKITLIAPDAKAMLDRICSTNPGMADSICLGAADEARKPIVLDAKDLRYDSREYAKTVMDAFSDSHTSCYFAIDSGTDLENLQRAIRLREMVTRVWIRRGTTQELDTPVIAFRCGDSDLANLSKETAVLNENLGAAWYNHYLLIPFGAARDDDSWRRLREDPQEKLSRCIHLQYCGHDSPEPPSKAFRRAAMESYYRRNYNRESSYEVALSMPYRLFNAHLKKIPRGGVGTIDVGMLPEHWDILDRDAYWSDAALERFSEAFERAASALEEATEMYDGTKDVPGELREIARWEHERWVRYMISRGWDAATPEQTTDYRRAGNGRWQLYVGRMHPCMIPFQDLRALEITLNADGGEDEKPDFRSLDQQNVRATGRLLSLVWERIAERGQEQEI